MISVQEILVSLNTFNSSIMFHRFGAKGRVSHETDGSTCSQKMLLVYTSPNEKGRPYIYNKFHIYHLTLVSFFSFIV
jgi:hypothetical protein